MALTLGLGVRPSSTLARPDLAAVCQAIGHGSLMGARGNSGVILSQILRGFASVGGADAGAASTPRRWPPRSAWRPSARTRR
jgi:dihydroxyacetone kinase-like predicted kinase